MIFQKEGVNVIEYTTIFTDDELIKLQKYWHDNDIHKIAVDFECEYNRHVYGCRLCLIQVFDGINYYIIDPFGLSEIELKKTLENKKLVKIFYGADSDISLVYKQYGIKMNGVLDLQIFVDALEYEKKGLDAVIDKIMGVKIENKKKYQEHDWTKRPIDEDAIQYALTDVRYLFDLKDNLLKMIIEQGKTEALLERIIKHRIDYDKESKPKIFKSKEFKVLTHEQKELAKKIYNIRESYSKEINCPPDNLLKNLYLINVSKNINDIENVVRPKKIIKEELWSKFRSEILQLKK